MDCFRGDHSARLLDRTTHSFVVDLSIGRAVSKLVARNRRTYAHLALEPRLVCLVRLHDRDRADPDLVFNSQAISAATFCYRFVGSDVCADDLAGALELFFPVDLRNRAADSPYRFQITSGCLDCLRIVDLANSSILGRADLA